jgi:hypothetical protein
MSPESFVAHIRKKLGPAPEPELIGLELSLRCQLPADYRTFLVACNGGYAGGMLSFAGPTETGEEADVAVHHIGGFRDEPALSLTWHRECYRGRIPDDLLWIMDDPYGNAICLGIREEHKGMIFFWDHENEPEDEWDGSVEGAGNLELLAETFADFVAGLREAPVT